MQAPDIGSHLQFSRNCWYASYNRIFNMSKVAVVRIFSSPRRCRKSSLRSHALRSLISVHSCLNICLFDTQVHKIHVFIISADSSLICHFCFLICTTCLCNYTHILYDPKITLCCVLHRSLTSTLWWMNKVLPTRRFSTSS